MQGYLVHTPPMGEFRKDTLSRQMQHVQHPTWRVGGGHSTPREICSLASTHELDFNSLLPPIWPGLLAQ